MSVQDWLWQVGLKKAVMGAVIGFLSAYGGKLAGAGITINQQVLMAFLVGAFTGLRNWLKVKKGITWL